MNRISFLGKLIALQGLALSCLVGQAQAQLIDDYSGGLGGYTGTVILDVNGGASNTSAWAIAGGELSLDTSSYDGIEQLAFIHNGTSLGVGKELQADFVNPIAGSRNFGLYVGGTAPTTGVRGDYISVYGGSDGTNNKIFTRGFDGTSEYNNLFGPTGPAYDTLFIARTDVNTFEVGYYEGAARTVIASRTPATANTADFVGYYADVRATGTIGFADNLRIANVVPEPSAIALLVFGTAGILGVRRRQTS